MAIGKMINRGCFQVENYKIVLRRRFPDLQEAAIGDLVVKFMPEIEKIFALPNFQVKIYLFLRFSESVNYKFQFL